MRFHAEHSLQGATGAVAALLADPAFYLSLTLPDLSRPELLETVDDGERAEIRLRYEYVGSLDPMARRLIGSGRLAWIQAVAISRSSLAGQLHVEAERDPRRLHGQADFTLQASGAGTLRRLEGELVVAVPGIGRMVERRIVSGVLTRLDLEAEAVDARLS